MLAALPTWEIWSLSRAPTILRERNRKLLHLTQYERVCIVTGGPKALGTSVTLDAGQAYEQTSILEAALCLPCTGACVIINLRFITVSVVQEKRGACKLGCKVSGSLNLRGAVLVLTFADICQYAGTVLCVVLIQVGDPVWVAPGVTIGGPCGRIALAAVSGFQKVCRDIMWPHACMPEEAFNRLARAGFKGADILAPSKYVDDDSCGSLRVQGVHS